MRLPSPNRAVPFPSGRREGPRSGEAELDITDFDEEFDDDGNGSRYTLSVQFNGHPAGYFDVATDPTLAEMARISTSMVSSQVPALHLVDFFRGCV